MRTNQQVIHIVAMCTCAASPLMHPSLRSSCCHFINIVIKAQIQCNCHCSVQSSSAVHFHISPPAVPTLHGHDRSPRVLHCSLCVLSKRCLVLRCIFETRCKMRILIFGVYVHILLDFCLFWFHGPLIASLTFLSWYCWDYQSVFNVVLNLRESIKGRIFV